MATQTVDQTQTVRLAPFQEKFLADIFASAGALTGQGSQMPYSAQQLEGLSEGQKNAIAQATQGIGAYSPYLQRGSEAIGQGIGAVGTGLGTIGSAIGQTAQADFTPTAYKEFMDPYMEDVIQRQYQDIADQGAKQQAQLSAGAVGAGAFGGSRQGIAQGEIAANVLDQQARTGSQLRSAGFQQAQNAAMQAAQQQLRQAQLTGQLGQTTGALGQTVGQLGTATAGLGQLGQQMGVQDVNTLLGVGGLQQQQGQKQLDVNRANALAQQALPYQQIGFMSDIFRGVPALQQTYSTRTEPGPSTQSQLMGLGIAGLGAYGMANRGTGNFFGMG
jgi:hypothetical protein